MAAPPPVLADAFATDPAAFVEQAREFAYGRLFWPWFSASWPARASSQQVVQLWAATEQAVSYLAALLVRHRGRGEEADLPAVARRTFLALEKRLSASVVTPQGRRVRLRGVADLVAALPDGQVVVIDWKTHPRPHEPTDLLQVAVYSLMMKASGVLADPVLVYFTPAPVERVFQRAEVEQALQGRLGPFLDDVARWADYLPDRDPEPPPTAIPPLCQACPYHPPCPERFAPAFAARFQRQAACRPGPSHPAPPGEHAASGVPAAGAAPWRVPAARRPAPGVPDATAALQRVPVGRAAAQTLPAATAVGSAQDSRLPVDPAQIEQALAALQLRVVVTGTEHGASFVRYRLEPQSGSTTVERLRRRAEDLKVRLHLDTEPLVGSGPGYIGLDIARPDRETVPVQALLGRPELHAHPARLKAPLGVGVGGRLCVLDLTHPLTCHLLVGGSTGSGKSVLLRSLLYALAALHGPEQVGFYLVDPKMVSFQPFGSFPHLRRPVLTDPAQVPSLLEALVQEMDARYRSLADAPVVDVDEFNERSGGSRMCHLVLVIDEFAELVLSHDRALRDGFQTGIARLGQKGRAAGIHLVLATQRPDRQVVAGLIKSNLQARVALKVADRVSSQVIIDRPGAESLAGHGDLLLWLGTGDPVRLQAPLVETEEIEALGASLTPKAAPPNAAPEPGG